MNELATMQNCGACAYFQMDLKDVNTGCCRRFPPTPFAIGHQGRVQIISAHPPANRGEFCGEFKPKLVM